MPVCATLEWMGRFKKILVLSFAALSILGAMIGIYSTIHSSLFLVQVVEVSDLAENSPVDAQAITQLAAVPAGVINLFDLDLRILEQRILSNHWIREVRLEKRFPQTVSISVAFREPQGIYQASNGALSYIDSTGKVFGQVNLRLQPDFPIFTGFARDHERKLQEGLELVRIWEKSPLRPIAQISSLHWDPERGFRALVTYGMGSKAASSKGRTMIDLGQEVDAQLEPQLRRLHDVIRYLSKSSIAAHQIWADAGKKIVVKTAHGS